jgi:predicted dehydrogenase
MSSPLRIGILGAGHLGRIHMRCLQSMGQRWETVGFFDPDPKAVDAVAGLAEEEGWSLCPPAFPTAELLLDAVDAVAIVTPTPEHSRLAACALERGVHCFIEKPVTTTLEEAEALLRARDAAQCVVQVGHVERFNPAFAAAQSHLDAPQFIEAHRLAPFNPRGLDVPVVLDLMIHDIDLALHVLEGEVVRVAANGVSVVGGSVDIANARLEFSSGAVANLTASRVSVNPMRKVRLFQPDAYLSVDLLNRSAQVMRLEDVGADQERDPFGLYLDVPGRPARRIHVEEPEVGQANAIAEELADFHAACSRRAACQVPLEDGLEALRVATEVMERIEQSLTPIS